MKLIKQEALNMFHVSSVQTSEQYSTQVDVRLLSRRVHLLYNLVSRSSINLIYSSQT